MLTGILCGACTSLVGVIPADVPVADAPGATDADASAQDATACVSPMPGYEPGDRDHTLRQPIDPRLVNFTPRGAGQDADGRLYVYGTMPNCRGVATATDVAVIRFTDTGAFDGSFGARGLACALREPGDARSEVPLAFAVDPRGRVVLAGLDDAVSEPRRPGVLVARFDAAGLPDLSFGRDGVARIAEAPVLAAEGGAALAALAEDDGVVVVGAQRAPEVDSAYGFVTRLLDDGRLDPSFNRGEVWVDRTTWAFSGVARTARGYAVAGASLDGFHPRVVMLGRDGQAVAGFGRDGVVTDARLGLRVRGLAIDPRGGMLLGGGNADDTRGVVVRLRADGEPDVAFGLRGGLVYLNVPWNPGFQLASTMATQCDGSLLVASNAEEPGFRLVRIDADGLRDARFGQGGSAQVGPLTDVGDIRVVATLVHPRDGRITVVTSWRGAQDLGLWRFWP